MKWYGGHQLMNHTAWLVLVYNLSHRFALTSLSLTASAELKMCFGCEKHIQMCWSQVLRWGHLWLELIISILSFFLQAFTFISYLWDTGGPDVVFISYFSCSSLLQLALIKINDVQTLIINCEAYLLFCSGSWLSKGKYWMCQFWYHKI